jgi:8-oxo-dGTP pyrophosphatase MutT (NUDIX family)
MTLNVEGRDDEPIRAAVLVPVYGSGDEKGIILTERSASLVMHAGQVAFPGGRYDPLQDTSLVATALRETFEEIGLPERVVEVIGALPERRTLSSNYMVSPFVGRVSASVSLRPDHREVHRVFRAPLRVFAESERRDRFVWTREGQSYEVPFVAVGDSRVWGVTLEIIDDLLIELVGMPAH